MSENLPRQFPAAATTRSTLGLHGWPRGFPTLKKIAKTGLAVADQFCMALSPGLVAEGPSLIVVALHSLCASKSQVDDPVLAPNQNVSVEDFGGLVEAMLECGYVVVSPVEVDAGLRPGGKYAMVTFDDGYFNNVLALDVLERYKVPATFFISSSHVLDQKAFWWDALSRELLKAGASRQVRDAETRKIKTLLPEKIDEYLHLRFGQLAFRPQDDRDRPFTRSELAKFARHPLVHLGNHTADHAILTLCSALELAHQIRSCQDALAQIAGYAPISIAYPNGNHSPVVVEAALSAGLRVGLTVQPHRNRLPLDSASKRMTLGRFYCHSGRNARNEFLRCRAGLIPSNLVKTMLQGP
jgi:peptidoglycan/xylan/chitin deacetylase (PgdA/CDA1 family)